MAHNYVGLVGMSAKEVPRPHAHGCPSAYSRVPEGYGLDTTHPTYHNLKLYTNVCHYNYHWPQITIAYATSGHVILTDTLV